MLQKLACTKCVALVRRSRRHHLACKTRDFFWCVCRFASSESPFSIDLHTIVPLTFRNHEHSHREESEKTTTKCTSQQHRTPPHHHHQDEKEDITLILASSVPLTLFELVAPHWIVRSGLASGLRPCGCVGCPLLSCFRRITHSDRRSSS